MSALPELIGFRVVAGTAARDHGPHIDRLTVTGRRTPVAIDGITGTVISPGREPGQAVSPASDGDLRLVFAGELYDREAIARAAGTRATSPDPEIVLGVLRRYGLAGFRLFNGRFAAVVAGARRIVVAADHAASVPVYLRQVPGGLEVATEAKALMSGPGGVGGEIPGTSAVAGSATVRRVRAGHVVVFDRDGGGPAPSWRTWAPPYGRRLLPPDEATAVVADRLGEAVRWRSPGGAVTVVLSGGIDSSAVAACARAAAPAPAAVTTVSMGTESAHEFAGARLVAEHLGTRHDELLIPAGDLLADLPRAVAAAEIADPDVLEYLLPLVALYRRLPGPPRRVLTGYGADIPLGGMHRTTEPLEPLDAMITADMDGFDGLNELSPVLAGAAGHWTTHPYWDRDLLDLLVALEPGLKRRDGRDKWVLRSAMARRLPEETVRRPKLGIHEGSGLTGLWTGRLLDAGLPAGEVAGAKRAMARWIYDAVVVRGVPPQEVTVEDALRRVKGGVFA